MSTHSDPSFTHGLKTPQTKAPADPPDLQASDLQAPTPSPTGAACSPTPRRQGPYHDRRAHRSPLEQHVDEVHERQLQRQERRKTYAYHGPLPSERPSLAFEPYITKELDRALRESLPAPVSDDPDLRAAVLFLRLHAHKDAREGGGLVFGEHAAALVQGKIHRAAHHKTGVRSMLEALETHLGAEITGYVACHYCSQVTDLPLPPALERVFAEELGRRAETPLEQLVHVRTGARLGRNGVKSETRRIREAANATVRPDAPERVACLQKALNALPRNRFSKHIKCLQAALLGPEEELPPGVQPYRRKPGKAVTPAQRSAWNVLAHAKRAPVPLYQMTERTLRLSPYGASLASLPSPLRQYMFADSLEVDADSIQLALAGALWELPTVQKVLRQSIYGGPSWWDVLVGDVLQAFDDNVYRGDTASYKILKGACKRFTYSLIFGMSRRNLRRFGTKDDANAIRIAMRPACEILRAKAPEEIGTVLLGHPAVSEILKARTKQFKDIKDDGGMRDVFERWIAHAPASSETSKQVARSAPTEETPIRDVQSVLAEAMQSMEMMAMLPVGETALKSRSMYMYLWQHDGITVRPKKSDRPSRYQAVVDRLNDEFRAGLVDMQERLDCGPIHTRLSVDAGQDHLPDS